MTRLPPLAAWTLVAAMLAFAVATLTSPWQVAIGLLVLAVAAMPHGRLGILAFGAVTAMINAILLGWLAPGTPTISVGPLVFGLDGAVDGVVGATRLTALLAGNLAAIGRVGAASWVDGLGLPPRWTAGIAAVVITAHDIGGDYRDLRTARRREPRQSRVRAALAVLPALWIHAQRRAERRREALRSAGIETHPRAAPIIAVTALAVAGRLALVALPNVSLTFVVVFLGGVVFGARVGAAAGAASMALTDLMLSGLLPTPFVNVPAMALVGAAGGLMRPLSRSLGDAAWPVRAAAASLGIASTFAFSVAADSLEWLMVPEYRATAGFLVTRIILGLSFNAIPALVNGALFAVAIGPVVRAFNAWQQGQGQRTP